MKKVIVPAIIAKTQKELDKRIKKVKNHAKLLQLDVMDGKFVKNKSLWFDFKLPKTKCRYEAHLMIKYPKKWIEKNSRKVHRIYIHSESCKDLGKVIRIAKKKRKKVGIAINPKTTVRKIRKYLNRIDSVLVMTVKPGKYGNRFVPSALKKVRALRKLKPKLNIEVDGGISPKTIKKASDAGADLFVSGSYIMKSRNAKKAIKKLEGAM